MRYNKGIVIVIVISQYYTKRRINDLGIPVA